MDDDALMPRPVPTAALPLLGQTVLVVEDSRFASAALRLMCLGSGARFRRADSLASAERHLRSFRPSVVIVDLGLPDGSGVELIATLARSASPVAVLLGTSGDDNARERALDAGADGFLAKPFASLAAFQAAVLAHLPRSDWPAPDAVAPGDKRPGDPEPDALSYRDDIAHIAALLEQDRDGPTLDYVAQFLGTLARTAEDSPLEVAASALARAREAGADPEDGLKGLTGLMRARLAG